LGLGLGLAPLESEATYTRPRPLKFGLEAEARPRVLTSLAKRIYNSTQLATRRWLTRRKKLSASLCIGWAKKLTVFEVT